MPHARDLILTVDVGTGSVRAGLVTGAGDIVALASVAHDTSYPRHGWVEQRPADWWNGAVQAIREVLAMADPSDTVAAVVCCGQMHAPVLIDAAGALVLHSVPLWNDKRATKVAADLNAGPIASVNPATSAWPGVKLHWLAQTDPATLARAVLLLMPKDYLNFRLTGEAAMDWSEAGSSFLSDPAQRTWSAQAARNLGLDPGILPPLLPSTARLGRVTRDAAAATGLPQGVPVLAGAGDFPAAILGSGVTEPGQVSDITGTSFLLTRLVPEPLRHQSVMNVAMASSGWGAFAVVDAAGDAVRWASRALDREQRSFNALSRAAATVPAGCEGLVFLPYLTGERLGQGEASRAAFVGLTARHSAAHLHRAVMEGVVLAMRDAFSPIAASTGVPDRIISAAGGARSDLWLQIKADVLNAVIVPTEYPESGIIGCACIGFAGLGLFGSASEAARTLVRYREPIMPDPDRRARYDDQFAAFRDIRRIMAPINDITGHLT
ncbi:xylulokinase [Cypionkella sp.]|uniref:xylulokinase n=1 Tax=Cypionkella sp. TaxID=2811411 RepID=UPI002ABCA788|nr:FGGY family carbohydrate kinase [Cypionkella sp.]MDZ4393185.1 FGGY family carbohydrate kinase [Cypionkella sp.]